MIKFTELKTEILQSLSRPEQCIKLTEELYNSCEKYAKVKELFWKVHLKIFSKKLFVQWRSILGSGFIYLLCGTTSKLFTIDC